MMKKNNKISRPGRASRSGSGDPSADPKRGAVLLIAILISSVALAVGFGVYNRTYKELLFASFWKQTQIAFGSADAGLECALYWELHPGPGGVGSAQCFGAPVPGWDPLGETSILPRDGVDIAVPGAGCVNIRVKSNGVATTTEARGYNTGYNETGNSTCDSTNPRRVERGLGAALQ